MMGCMTTTPPTHTPIQFGQIVFLDIVEVFLQGSSMCLMILVVSVPLTSTQGHSLASDPAIEPPNITRWGNS